MSLADIQGFAQLLDDAGFDVHVGEVPSIDDDEMPRRYALVLLGFTPDIQERLTGSRAPRRVSAVVHAYARAWQESQWLADRIDELVRPNGWGRRPVVPGRSCDPVMRVDNVGAEPDRDGHPVWFHAINVYEFMSRPV